MKSLIDRFETFYLSKHSGRKLTWLFNYGTVDIRSRAGRSPHVLTVSTYQAMILLMFNSLESLRVLLRESSQSSKEPTSGDIFRVNTEFESRVRSVKVPLIALANNKDGAAESSSSGNAIPQVVEEDRKHIVEAVLVRIMKSRKQLDHNLLVVEATEQLSQRFRPTPQLIKQRIEHLIERDFLERCPHDHKT
ncbi:cullin, putative, partial [Perkinsus marinus ATCC 50983]